MIYNREKDIYYSEKKGLALKFFYKTIPGRILLKIAITKPVSQIGGLYMDSPLSKFSIKRFIRKNNIDMNDYPEEKYKSFNHFFTRKIKVTKRPITKDFKNLIAPADSRLTAYKIGEDTRLNVKNSIYTVEEILKDKKLAAEYKNGYCLVYRLAVDDYHHYHFIDDGKVVGGKKIKGVLHTVSPITNKKDKVFSENHREYSILETKNFGKVIQVEVGALMVGKIKNKKKKEFKRGEEKGYFCFGGSTIIMLFKENTIKLDEDILTNSKKHIETKIKLGEKVGRRKVNDSI